jgi:hypothetical protein
MKLHIEYVRSLADNAKVRAASLQYIRDSLTYFYPESAEILRQANELAKEFGEPLGVPYASWKYAWIVWLLGWRAAKIAQHWIRRTRWKLAKKLDYLLFRIGGIQHFLPTEVRALSGRSGSQLEPSTVRVSRP